MHTKIEIESVRQREAAHPLGRNHIEGFAAEGSCKSWHEREAEQAAARPRVECK